MALVDYASDSEDDNEQDNLTAKTTAAVSQGRTPRRPAKRKLPALSLAADGELSTTDEKGSFAKKAVKGEWLCHVYIELPQSTELTDLCAKADQVLRNHGKSTEHQQLSCNLLGGGDSLHVSLTRPVLIRGHERDAFSREVKDILCHSGDNKGFDISLAQTTHFLNDDSTRLFFALEIAQGHEELLALTRALDLRLSKTFQVKGYYEEARFHSSFAYLQQTDNLQLTEAQIAFGQDLTRQLARQLDTRLLRMESQRIREVCIRVGQNVTRVALT
ncbi:unnamed protein product [Sympodiomycopsis kandeliae]